jgi:hypothetical protein
MSEIRFGFEGALSALTKAASFSARQFDGLERVK